MKKLRTEDLREGMKFTHAVYIDKHNILVGPNVAIKQKDIDRLLSWGIYELETAGELCNFGSGHSGNGTSTVAQREAELRKIVEMQQLGREKKAEKNQEESLVTVYAGWVKAEELFYSQAKNNKKIDQHAVKSIVTNIINIVKKQKPEIIAVMRKYESDDYTFVHGVNVAILGAIVGVRLGFTEEQLLKLTTGCLFIDIGMVLVPTYIINKRGELTSEERKKIHTHPVYSYKILVQDNGMSLDIGRVALEHQEQCDGQGYPRKLTDKQISLHGKIAAVVDAYDAMTKRRSYREEYISYEAMRNILTSGQQKFDAAILKVFLKEMGVFPLGSFVLLNNNSVAEVVETNPDLPMRPVIKIVKNESPEGPGAGEVVELAKEQFLFIVKAVEEKEGGL